MKATLHRESFLAAFGQAQAVAPTKGPKPALNYILLDCGADKAYLHASDTEQSLRIELTGVEVDAPGKIMLPIALVGSVLRESSDEALKLNVEKTNLRIRGQSSDYKLATMDPEEFPVFEDSKGEGQAAQSSAAGLLTGLKRTVFACDPTSSRYALGGVLFQFAKNDLNLVATDGSRLSKYTLQLDESPEKNTEAVVPEKSVKTLQRLLAGFPDGGVDLLLTANWLRAEVGPYVFRGRLLEGRFPNWKAVIDGFADDVQVQFLAGPLHQSIRQAAIALIGSETSAMDFRIDEGQLTLVSKSESSTSEVELPLVAAAKDRKLDVSLNHRYVTDALKTFDDEQQLTFCGHDSASAVKIIDGNGFLYVAMPLNTEK